MRAWAVMLGGLIVWAAHFLGVYAIASIADVYAHAEAPAGLWGVAVLTLACVAADALLLARAVAHARRQDEDLSRFVHALAGLGAALSLVAVIWQGLPALLAG